MWTGCVRISIISASAAAYDVENDKAYWLFTYKLVGYYPEYLRVVDGSTVFNWESYTENADGTVTYKINVSDLGAGIKYPHLQVMEVTYTGAGHTDAGDIHAPSFPDGKSVAIGKKEYKMSNRYSMPTIEIIDLNDGFTHTGYSLVEEDGKPILLMTYRCVGYDYTTAEFFDGTKVLPYTITTEGALVTYHIDLTNTVGGDFYCHLRLEGQLWNGKDNTTSSNGDCLAPGWTGGSTGTWNNQATITVNGQKYNLGIMWAMLIIGH